jgi:3-dehydroquinate dehydratase/shikimate dehydrogenase
MIIVSVIGPTMKDALAQIRGSSRYADAFELRLDLIHEPPLSMLMATGNKPIVATCRPTWEGGAFNGREAERIEILEAALLLGAEYVDVELFAEMKTCQHFLSRRGDGNFKVILSHHSLKTSAINIPKLYAKMRASQADVLKLAYPADDAADVRHAVQFLNLARRDKQRAVAIAAGEAGESSRVLYKVFGGWATYAAPEDGTKAAPGQIRASLFKNLYRVDESSRRTKVFGVVGNPLSQSKGIFLHNPLLRRERKNAIYCKFLVANLAAFMRHIAPLLSGFSVTIPHKQSVMKFLDKIEPTAEAIGAVNTVVRRRGRLVGVNTDASGALDAIEKVLNVRNKHMLVVGAGGAARAIASEAKRRGANVYIMNRHAARARKLAREFGLHYVRAADVRGACYDIITNATSVGMTPHVHQSPLPKSILKGKVVFDAVYNPPMTKLLRDAKSMGARIIQGTEMYMNQAALQFQLYAGTRPSISTMRRILKRAE